MRGFLLVVLLLCSVSGYPSGPPAADYPSLVCQELSPSSQAHGPPHSGHGGYLLQLQPPLTQALYYQPGVEYSGEVCMHSLESRLVYVTHWSVLLSVWWYIIPYNYAPSVSFPLHSGAGWYYSLFQGIYDTSSGPRHAPSCSSSSDWSVHSCQ